ncbi:peptide chain release factor N(5)-glutamine methyltransferase [Bifidobacterium sp. ESL0763]|uniref:peptide chain release factor N(5)-glutamine methyltransferase n=1 Tax=Bifidobacterium sp. ESL0763 TaxID=2983227 RepID=UPI0023F77E8F|nr:peptide chain release factor N(5)-glutamine methyltransferase [Bifidobacterium sp. ESL0763]MDF7663567.1 peptide chain release factor N(5)-glutamine methyltransferase [Bifidobacterium sp. ESL0763]
MSQQVGQDVSQIIKEAADRLRRAGVDTPEHDAKLLLAEACGATLSDIDKAMLMGSPLPLKDGPASGARDADIANAIDATDESTETKDSGNAASPADALERFDAMVARRAKREPLQYIVGHAPFRYLDLEVGPGVFIPRPETETVVQAAIDWIMREKIRPCRVVDLCAGSGAIGLSIVTEISGSEVWAVEWSRTAIQWAERNMRRIFGKQSLAGYNYHLKRADATDMTVLSQLDGTIDVVVTNPPYVPQDDVPAQPEVRDHDPQMALYGGSPDGALIPEQMILRAARLLRSGGALVMEHDISQGGRLVDFARVNGFRDAKTGDDLTGRPRYLFAIKR